MRLSKVFFVLTALALPALILGCPFGNNGITQNSIKQINVDGFDADDQICDDNDYAYGMTWFNPTYVSTKAIPEDGTLYVGTGNNVAGLVGAYVEILLAGGEISEAFLPCLPIRPPEILRYRPDWGPKSWETVFDYRDLHCGLEPEDIPPCFLGPGDPNPTCDPRNEGCYFTQIGFRFMTTVDAAVDEGGEKPLQFEKFIYAATQGLTSDVWRSKTGDYGDWEKVFTLETFSGSIRWIEEHNGKIYLAVAYDSFGETPPPGEIWCSETGLPDSWVQIVADGFGDPENVGVQALISYDGYLWAGTKNDTTGFEVWKGENDTKNGWIKVVENGGPESYHENAGMPVVFNDELYWGSQLYVSGLGFASGNFFRGFTIIRINEGVAGNFETIVGTNSLSGYDDGFDHWMNAYNWWMAVHSDGYLYATSYDAAELLGSLFNNLQDVIDFFSNKQEIPPEVLEIVIGLLDETLDQADWDRLFRTGADLYKTADGVNWEPVSVNGLNDNNNYGIRTMVSAPDGHFYIGTANPTTGSEIWRTKQATPAP